MVLKYIDERVETTKQLTLRCGSDNEGRGDSGREDRFRIKRTPAVDLVTHECRATTNGRGWGEVLTAGGRSDRLGGTRELKQGVAN